MFKKKEDSNLNTAKLNKLISLSHNVLNVLFIVLIVAGIYVATIILKETQVLSYLFVFLSILTPLFIGLIIAWLINPFVSYLHTKGIRRAFGATLCYLIFFIIIYLILNSLIPLLANQINEFVVNTIPVVFDNVENWINIALNEMANIEGFDIEGFKEGVFSQIEVITKDITSSLPDLVVTFVSSLFSGIGVFVIGLIIGFMLLIDFDKYTSMLFNLVPKRHRRGTKEVADVIEQPLRRYITGALIDCSVVFVISSIAFSLIGLESALLFALFCAITNIIPYFGPYIGGAPAVLVGLTQSWPIGIGVFISIAVLQFLEGNFLQPYIMSKTTKLNPIIIILGLLVFGHFFGILGMILSTPVLAIFKELFTYFNEKYDLINVKVE